MFYNVKVPEKTGNDLNNDLKEIKKKWAFQGKRSFNPNHTKQAQEIIFNRKTASNIHPKVFCNKVDLLKHLGLYLE